MLLALSADEVGEAVIDWHTPVQFGIGFAAGTLGVSPLLLTALFIGGTALSVAASDGVERGFFEPADGQSRANELMDLFAKIAGAWAGGKARSMISGGALPASGLGGKIIGARAAGGLTAADRALLAAPLPR